MCKASLGSLRKPQTSAAVKPGSPSTPRQEGQRANYAATFELPLARPYKNAPRPPVTTAAHIASAARVAEPGWRKTASQHPQMVRKSSHRGGAPREQHTERVGCVTRGGCKNVRNSPAGRDYPAKSR